MAKIYRTGLLLAVIMTAALSLTSCVVDDEDPFITGNWRMVAPLGDFYNEFSFRRNGTGYYYVEDYYGQDTFDIIWYTSGNQLTVEFPDQMDQMYFTWQSNGDVLYLYPWEGGDTWIYNRF
ncbi:MAG: hypothetical protein K2H83_03825 [Duncaniella sp.]|nr:hypothetical protein [Duncaniella sp.]MDE5734254.1 hypothetical protein [Duncaniella sp.]